MSRKSDNMADFGAFLSDLVTTQQGVSGEVLNDLKKEFVEKKKDEVRNKLRSIHERMQQHVTSLRDIRRREKAVQSALKDLRDEANRVVAGLDDAA